MSIGVRRRSRRRFLVQGLGWAAGLGLLSVGGCQGREPLLRLASNTWPGYALLYLARELDFFHDDEIRLVEMPSTTAVLQVVAGNTVEAACLTLDELLSARADGLDLVALAVLDVSLGADVLLAQPGIKHLGELAGKRIGVEQTAVGAVMLEAVLHAARLKAEDIKIVALTADRHQAAFRTRQVDALITFEPFTSQLRHDGAMVLFSSAEIPGRIIDVLCAQRAAIGRHPRGLQTLLAGHFRARAAYLAQPLRHAAFLAKQLHLESAAQVAASYAGLELTDLAQNRTWLGGTAPRLEQRAAELAQIMLRAGLLPRAAPTRGIADGSFLPETVHA